MFDGRPTPTDWRRLHDLLRAGRVGDLPERLNQRTATSAVAPHSKSTLSPVRLNRGSAGSDNPIVVVLGWGDVIAIRLLDEK